MIAFSSIVTELYPLLNAASEIDLVWWNTTELLAMMDESDALGAGIFAEYTEGSAIPIIVGSAAYTLPANCAAVVDVEVAGASLRRATMADLEARSDTWETDTGTPTHFILNEAGHRNIRFWPAPDAITTANLIYHTWPDVNVGATHRAPSVFGMFHKYAALSAARAKAGDGQAQDIAEAAQQRADVIKQVCVQMFGGVK